MASNDSSNGAAAATGEKGAFDCTCGEIEGEHQHDEVTGLPMVRPTKQSTMSKTAQEGLQYLKNCMGKGEGEEDEEEDDEEDDEDTTGGLGEEDDEDELTGENGDESNSGGIAITKQRTMLTTAKEGQELLENYMGGKPDPNARTRGQQRVHEESGNGESNDSEPDPKRPRRTQTMLETTQEAKRLLEDPNSMGATRSETVAMKKPEQEESVGKE